MTRTRWVTASVVALVVVLAASLAPGSTAGGLPAVADKLLHVAGYAVVAGCAARAVGDPDAWTVGDTDGQVVGDTDARAVDDPGVRQLAVVVLAVATVGAGVELLQPAVGRNASAADAVANLVGALLGVLAVHGGRRR